jgi:hypothetical protein
MNITKNHQLNPKKIEEYKKERISYKSAHHIRHGHAELKRIRRGRKRTHIKAIIRKAIINDSLEELSAPLIKSILIPFEDFYRPEAPTLKVIVERKLKRRIDTHKAKKLRQQKSFESRIILKTGVAGLGYEA